VLALQRFGDYTERRPSGAGQKVGAIMNSFRMEGTANAPPSDFLAALVNVEAFAQFVPWVQSARVDKASVANGGREIDASIQVTTRAFSGWVSARVSVPKDESVIKIRMTKGPFKLAEVEMHLGCGASPEQTKVLAEVRYATPLAIYRSLVDKHKRRMFDHLIELFARRHRSMRPKRD
jgi:ribosome-associated toxin RatA of RatAB toxin-antitoxin module